MAQLHVSTTITISDEEAAQLAAILGCEVENLADELGPVTLASLTEYIRMFLGQAVFTRGSDMQEWRLFLLIKHLFGNRIPYEQNISDLFQTTSSRSRGLVRSVMSKYQYELKAAIDDSMREILEGCPDPDDGADFEVAIFNDNLVESMNRLLAQIDGALPPVGKKRGTVTTFVIRPSSLAALTERLGVQTND